MSPDRAHRLWRRHGVQVPRHWPRRQFSTGRPRPQLPEHVNHAWTYDFVFDACANGQRLKCLTVVDECIRDRLAIDVASAHLARPRLGIDASRGAAAAHRQYQAGKRRYLAIERLLNTAKYG